MADETKQDEHPAGGGSQPTQNTEGARVENDEAAQDRGGVSPGDPAAPEKATGPAKT